MQNSYPPTYALVIGINAYQAAGFPRLNSAIADATAFFDVLLNVLHVPRNNITFLLDARRQEIINGLRSFQLQPKYEPGAAFIVYFAGHGASSKAPPGWQTENGKIQMLIPSDYDGVTVQSIPDRTIGLLLEELAAAKGDNISVIFDCCYSGSGTRSLEEPEEGVQFREGIISKPIPPDIDANLFSLSRGSEQEIKSNEFAYAGLETHILLAACKSDEKARESRKGGAFTSALTQVLKEQDFRNISYTELIQELPALINQNPQCEGINRKRILFQSFTSNRSDSHRVHVTDGPPRGVPQFYVKVGEAYGITKDATFALYSSRSAMAFHPPLGTCRVRSLEVFKTTLAVPPELASSFSTREAVVIVNDFGSPEPFHVHIPSGEWDGLQPIRDGVTRLGSSHGGRKIMFTQDDKKAQFRLTAHAPAPGYQQSRRLICQSLNPSLQRLGFQPSGKDIGPPPRPGADKEVALLSEDIHDILSAASLFDFHLRRSNSKIGPKHIQISFIELRQNIGSTNWDGPTVGFKKPTPLYTPISGNLIVENPNRVKDDDNYGTVNVEVSTHRKRYYGTEIKNTTSYPLYVSAFDFDHSDLSISSYYQPPSTSSGVVDPPLPPGASLTIGFTATDRSPSTSAGTPPVYYKIPQGQEMDVCTMKFFFSTQAVDLSHLVQDSPFNGRSRAGRLKQATPRELWGTFAFSIVQRRAK